MNSHASLAAVYLTPERPSITALRRVLAQHPRDSRGSDALLLAVRDAAHEMREAAVPPEGVVIVLKAVLEQARIRYLGILEPHGLYEFVITAGIREYFSRSAH